jgi:type IV pilus assembly protein PilY1
MKIKHWILLGLLGVAAFIMGRALTAPGELNISQQPLFLRSSLPPLNMLVMGRDHKLYYEAYNDASDLNEDGVLDVGYKPDTIDYYGYYNSHVCYQAVEGTGGQLFRPVSEATGAKKKQCSNMWSGDFLNYVTTSRMDALRKVLFGGYREVDSTNETILRAAYIPEDAHSWGKEYQSEARDGYDIAKYTPYAAPAAGRYVLFAVTTLSDNGIPQMRVLNNTPFRIWNWVSIERPVAGDDCFTASSTRVNCVNSSQAGWEVVPSVAYANPLEIITWKDSIGNPGDKTAMDNLFAADKPANDRNTNRCGAGTVAAINTSGGNNNPFSGSNGCTHDNYHTRISGQINITQAGNYKFAVNGDDAVDVAIDGTVVASWYGGHGQNNGADSLNTHSGTVYLNAGLHSVVFRHEEGGGDDNWQLYWIPPANANATAMTNYALRVEACSATAELREDNCKIYPSGAIKPTGILHDYGETDRMYFGLLTGSYAKNISGGVLRKNMGSFSDEINPSTGQYCLNGNCGNGRDVKGVVHTISTFRMLDFRYSDYTYGCGWITTRPVNEGECWMWGNPVAEMMYETLRYFGGAKTPRSEFNYTSGVDESTLGLSKPAWKPPYVASQDGGGGYPKCSQPTMTVLSDINPSYDYSVPGTHWGTMSSSGDPDSLQDLNVSAQVDKIWELEGGGARSIFIGESNGVTDNAPTPKTVSNLSTVRGLSPEEPSKQGTFYSAGVARYGATNFVGGDKHMRTYSVALASPLPKFKFPVGNGSITLVPFAKSVAGSSISATSNFQPTNQIVDFYVQKVANTDPRRRDYDKDTNGGRPYAEFRINYEDVEQGADHDMDAFVLYTLAVNQTNQLVVSLSSEYAAGGISQYMGYVISGTTADGVYLEVKDQGGDNVAYRLNTPPGRAPGYCNTQAPPNDCVGLPLNATRTFDVGNSAGAGLLESPLWYAAKYGTDLNPDANNDGIPDNYFLVTNPLYLKTQLTKTFDAIERQDGSSGAVTVSGARVSSSSYVVAPSYGNYNNGADWVGDLQKFPVLSNGLLGTVQWSAAAKMPTDAAGVAQRKIFTALSHVDSTNRANVVREFTAANLVATPSGSAAADAAEIFNRLGYTAGDIVNKFGGNVTPGQLVDYLRGDQAMEGTAKNTAPFRRRSKILGDIVNSAPVIATKRANYGWATATGLASAARGSYAAYLTSKGQAAHEYIYAGFNDGMLHAFNDAGDETFAYVPNGVLNKTGFLADAGLDGGSGYTHRFYVDGQLTTADVYLDGHWKTVVVGTAGAGGRSAFALDVTDPASFSADEVLWEINGQGDTELGYAMGKPVVVPLQNGKWVALIGNGYNSVNSDPVLFVVDIETGSVLAKLRPNDDDDVNVNGLGNLVTLDTDGNGLVDTVYGGDLQGNVWKFDLSGANASDWNVAYNGVPMFVAHDLHGARQPITGEFEVATGPGNGYMLYFGTGRYFTVGDNSSAMGQQVQSLYGVWDNGTPVTGDRDAALVAQTITASTSGTRSISRNAVNYLQSRGWYLDLVTTITTNNVKVAQTTGERFFGRPLIQSGSVSFSAYQPEVASDCDPGGQNWLYRLNLLTGAPAYGQVTLPDGTVVSGGSVGATATGSGAPSRGVAVTQPVASEPVYCDPADSTCTGAGGPQQCKEVTLNPNKPENSLISQRSCGRQSWRQIK